MTRRRLAGVWRATLLALLLGGLFAMHGVGAHHVMPMTSEPAHVMAAAMGQAPTTGSVMHDVPSATSTLAGASTVMELCVVVLTAGVLLLVLLTGRRRRRGLGFLEAKTVASPWRPRPARPKRVALTLTQLCILRT